ncbi:MAG: hypothetical protein RJS97_02800 [Parvibaculaceae bacterium]
MTSLKGFYDDLLELQLNMSNENQSHPLKLSDLKQFVQNDSKQLSAEEINARTDELVELFLELSQTGHAVIGPKAGDERRIAIASRPWDFSLKREWLLQLIREWGSLSADTLPEKDFSLLASRFASGELAFRYSKDGEKEIVARKPSFVDRIKSMGVAA